MDDDQIIHIASRSKESGAIFKALWDGQWENHFGSQSEADASLVCRLAYCTKDSAQIDRLFRRSELMRDKWDEYRGAQTYGELTISSALDTVTDQYKARTRRAEPRTAVDSEDGCAAAANLRPGAIDPDTGRLILSTQRTLPTAEAFVRQFHQHPEGMKLRFYAGLLMVWRNNRYLELEDAAIQSQLLPWLHEAVKMRATRDQGVVSAPFPANPQSVRAALESIKAYTFLEANTEAPSWIDKILDRPDACEILPCRSKLLHLPTMSVLAPTPMFFSVAALDYDHDQSAPKPQQWLAFLHELLEDDLSAWALLQQWFGYSLTGDTSQQKMLLIVGPKRSGKGTIARVLTRLVGPQNVCGPTTSSLAGPFGLQPLVGKSLAIVSDARFSGKDMRTVVERLLCISGEDALTIDRKHIPSVTMKLPTRFVFLTNELPRLNDSSCALAGRFMVLRLTKSFYGREDMKRTNKLLTELPGILNWSIVGWRDLRERGQFVQPASVEDVLRQMEDISSPVGAFVRERCDVEAGLRIWVDDLYVAWKGWCERDGRINATTKQTFGRDLMAAVAGVLIRQGTNGVRFYQGIALKGSGQ